MAGISRYTQDERMEGRVYLTAGEDGQPSPPPPRPRSNSLPVSGYRGARARAAAAQAAVELPQDAMAVDVAPASSTPDVAPASSTQRVCLPVDVISDILEALSALESIRGQYHAHLAAFRALGVDRTWRKAAQRTHCLWRCPYFDSRGMLGDPVWIEYHTCFVRYGGACGFDVLLDNDVAAIPATDPVWEYFSENILANARSITLQIRDSTADPDILAGRTYNLLRSLRVRFTGRTQDHPDVVLFMEAPELRKVELYRTQMAFDDFDDRQTNPMWAITSLDVTRAQYTLEDLADLSQLCVVLREFAFTVQRLFAYPCNRFTWPSLETLRVTVQSVSGDEALPFRVWLPNVTTLEITDNRSYWPFWRRFVEISCPALTELHVYRNHMDYGKQFVDGIGGLSCVRTLVLRDGSMNEDVLARLFDPVEGEPMPFPNLERLHFDDTVPLRGFSFNTVRSALHYRYQFRAQRHMPGPFFLTCALKRKPGEQEQNEIRGRVEQSVREYNELAWASFNTRY